MGGVRRRMDMVDVRVLSALSRDPVGTAKNLSAVARLSQAGFARRLRKLGEAGILYPGFARAQVAYTAVGLEMCLVLANVPAPESQRFERACDLHPYTQFRIRCVGRLGVNSFLALFSNPVGSRHKMLEFLDGLKKADVVESYSTWTPIAKPGRQEFDFTFYDLETGAWNVDWERWEQSIDGQAGQLSDLPRSALHLLDSKDMRILRSLSTDAREAKWKVAEKAGVKGYELSRRLARYSENAVIDGYRMIHAKEIAELALTVIVFAKASVDVTRKVCEALRSLPFQGTAYAVENGLAYVGNVPSPELTKFTRSLEAHCGGVEVGLCDYSSSMRYIFDNDPSNYSAEAGWRQDRAFLIEAPLASLGQTSATAREQRSH